MIPVVISVRMALDSQTVQRCGSACRRKGHLACREALLYRILGLKALDPHHEFAQKRSKQQRFEGI